MRKHISILLLSIFLLSCNYQENSKVEYYESGKAKSVKRYRSGILNGQSQWFYDNGNVEQIVIFTEGKENGNSYYFYKDGSLRYFRHWSQGKMVGWAKDFYDDIYGWTTKSVLLFNNDGDLIYKRNYDRDGQIMNEEGSYK